MRNGIIALATAAVAMLATPAHAVDNGIYLGASVGQSGVQFDETLDGNNFDYDADSTGFKIIGGWRFLDWLSVEANYVDLGSGDDTVQDVKVETDINGISLSAVGFLPIGPVDLFARVGAINWNADLTAPSIGLDANDDGTDLTYGVGAQFRVWSLGIRAEYEWFDVSDIDTVDMISVGVTWTFL